MSEDRLEVRVPVATVWTGPTAPRDVDEPARRAEPDVAAWTAAMRSTVRKGLDGRTLTQLLMGEPVLVLESRGDWVRVAAPLQPSSRDDRGYPGWMLRAHLGAPVVAPGSSTATVVSRSAAAVLEDGSKVDLSFGTVLPVAGPAQDPVRLLLPDDRSARLPLADVRLGSAGDRPGHDADDILAAARQFLGLRYLWGGTSGWGLDCSGLVHLAYRAYGVVVPRDAFDQAGQVEPVPLADVEPGDLYFFARPGERVYHVGFVTRPVATDGTRWMLHAPESGELIEDAPMAPHRVATLVSAGRVPRPAPR